MACAGRRSSRSAPRRIWPPSAGVRPLIALKSVVLPAPFGPMRPVMEPSPTDSVQPVSASTPPNRLVTPVIVRSGVVTGPPSWRRTSSTKFWDLVRGPNVLQGVQHTQERRHRLDLRGLESDPDAAGVDAGQERARG